jgi:hypothetical protein
MLFEQRSFQDSTEMLDGKQYKACEFRNCRLVYRGGPPPYLIQCHFAGCEWVFEDAAERTISFLVAMYHGIAGGKELIDATFDSIRQPQRSMAGHR